MTVTHVGSTRQYASGWESIFGGGKKTARPAAKAQASGKKPSAKKKAAKKKAARKQA